MLLSSMSGLKRTVAMDPEGVDWAGARVDAPSTSAIAKTCKRCMSSSQGDFRNPELRHNVAVVAKILAVEARAPARTVERGRPTLHYQSITRPGDRPSSLAAF